MEKRDEQRSSRSASQRPGTRSDGRGAAPKPTPPTGPKGPARSVTHSGGSPFQSQTGGPQFRRIPGTPIPSAGSEREAERAPKGGPPRSLLPARPPIPGPAAAASPNASAIDRPAGEERPVAGSGKVAAVEGRDAWDRAWANWSWDAAADGDSTWSEAAGWGESQPGNAHRDAWGDRPAEGTMYSLFVSAAVPAAASSDHSRYAGYRDNQSGYGERARYDQSSATYRRGYEDEGEDGDHRWDAMRSRMVSIAGRAVDGTRQAAAVSRNAFVAVFRWARTGFSPELKPPRRAINLVLLVSILGTLFLSGAGMGLYAYNDYNHIKTVAFDGLRALEAVPTDLGISKSGSGGQRATPAQVQAARDHIALARADFQDLNDRLVHPDLILAIAGAIPSLKSKLAAAKVLSDVALDATQLMEVFLPTMTVLANVIAGSPVSTANAPTTPQSQAPLLQVSDIPIIQKSLADAAPLVDSIVTKVQSVPQNDLINALPSSSNQAKMTKYMAFLPMLKPTLNILQTFAPVFPTLLGIAQPANYLIMTLDSAEIRPVGGFQGQFSILSVNAGHVGQIKLRDVYQIEPVNKDFFGYENAKYPTYGRVGQYPPKNFGFYGWFKYGWALRDSGLSPDFAQSAEYALGQIEAESTNFGGKLPTKLDANGHPVALEDAPKTFDGVIMFQSSLISQILKVTGPIHIGAPYNVDVNNLNVTQKIHYYQETDAGRAIGTQVSGTSTATKRFTELVSQALLEKIRSVAKDKLLGLVTTIIEDFHSRDIMLYFKDQKIENILRGYQISNEIYQGTTDDSLVVNETNISGNKIDQYLTEVITDNILLDKAGTASHTLTIDYLFQIPEIKGDPNKYIQVPSSSQTVSEMQLAVYNTIFNAGYDAYSKHYRRIYISSRAQSFSGPRMQSLSGATGFADNRTLDSVYNTTTPELYANADVPNHAMIGGYYVYMWYPGDNNTVQWKVPNGEKTVRINWKVPTAVTANGTYTLHLQRQSGMSLGMNVTITSACGGGPLLHAEGPLNTDQLLSVTVPKC